MSDNKEHIKLAKKMGIKVQDVPKTFLPMKNSVSSLDTHRPHFTINCEGFVLIISEDAINAIIDGHESITCLRDWEIVVRTILKDWRDFIKEEVK